MTKLLTEEEIRSGLAALPEWHYDENTLVRDVTVADDSKDPLEQAVMQAGDEFGHHPEVERNEDGLRLILWTHSDGGVTERDLELAGRLDQVLTGSSRDKHASN